MTGAASESPTAERMEVRRAIAADPATIFAIVSSPDGHYELEPFDGGTIVTQFSDWSDIHPQWKEADIFPVIPESALRATLGILARTAAPGKPRPGLPDD